jgi:hypothetical protein
MSAATSADRNQESIGNTMGAPGVAAQQKLEQQPAASVSTTGEQHAEAVSGQQQQSGSSGTSSQQAGENVTEQPQTKS